MFNFTGYLPRKKAVSESLQETSSTSMPMNEVKIGDSTCFNFTGYNRKRPLEPIIPTEITTTECSGWLLKSTGDSSEASVKSVKVDVEEIYDGDVNAEDGDVEFMGFNDNQRELLTASDKSRAFSQVSDEDLAAAEKFSKASDFAMKQHAMNVPVHLFLSFCPCKSARDCNEPRNCIARICRDGNLEDVFAQQRFLWGPRDSKEPTSKLRGDRLLQLQQKAWVPATRQFSYSFRASTSGTATIVCENTYLHMLGFRSDESGRCRSGQFNDNKKRIESNEGFYLLFILLLAILQNLVAQQFILLSI